MLSYTLSTIVAFLALTSRSASAHDDACLHDDCNGVAAKLNTLFLNEDGTIEDSGVCESTYIARTQQNRKQTN